MLDRAASAPRTIAETARRAIDGGVDAVVCRLKELPEEELLPLAAEVREICEDTATPFVMSHFARIASNLGADAVHVGASDPPLPEVRRTVGPDMVIGYSAHSIPEARQQLEAGADYVFVGPVFATPAKLQYGEPLGLEVARQAVADLDGIVVCIGGINNANLSQLVTAGIHRVAAIAALQKNCDPAASAREFRRLLEGEGGAP